jgi:hypothetical protein
MFDRLIKKTFDVAKRRNWDKTFWAIDIHETMIIPNYKKDDIPKTWYPYALEVMQILSKRKDVCLILFTCSHPHEIELYLKYFNDNGVNFEHVNSNPEVLTDTQGYGNYDDKFYFNLLLDDKAGFDANNDWEIILNILIDDEKQSNL